MLKKTKISSSQRYCKSMKKHEQKQLFFCFAKKKNMQREEEIYKRILNAVLSVTELTEQQLLFSRTEECVDARCVLIELLTKCGFSDSRCAKHTQRTRSAVCMMRNRFRERSQRKFVALTLSDVKDFLERNKFESNQ